MLQLPVFISANKYIEFFSKIQQIYSWKSKGISEESIKNFPELENTFDPDLINNCPLPDKKLAGNCLRLGSISFYQNVVQEILQ